MLGSYFGYFGVRQCTGLCLYPVNTYNLFSKQPKLPSVRFDLQNHNFRALFFLMPRREMHRTHRTILMPCQYQRNVTPPLSKTAKCHVRSFFKPCSFFPFQNEERSIFKHTKQKRAPLPQPLASTGHSLWRPVSLHLALHVLKELVV